MLMGGDEVQEHLRRDDEEPDNGDQSDGDGHSADAADGHGNADQAVQQVVALAEKYWDRVDAAQLLELLPENTPVALLLRYFKIVLEYGSTQKRNLQVRTRV
jgi:hypothetical protein